MSHYLDASVMVPTLLVEKHTGIAVDWIETASGDLMVSDLGRGEVVSALHRAVRERRCDLAFAQERLADFERWRARDCTAVSHAPSDVRIAVDYVSRFELALRMPDALHLAACARLGLTLATFDRRLLCAAEALGVVAVRPG